MVMVSTRPRGAKPVKFFTILSRNQRRPSFEKKFFDMTISPVAGLVRLVPRKVKIVPRMATIKNRNTNSMVGGGSLLQTVSTPSMKRASNGFFSTVFSFMAFPPLVNIWKKCVEYYTMISYIVQKNQGNFRYLADN